MQDEIENGREKGTEQYYSVPQSDYIFSANPRIAATALSSAFFS